MERCHILRMLRGQGRHLSFHTPGHKRAGMDITELSYSDDLSDPTGVIALAQRDGARILGADAAFFLTDGSTCGIYAMLYALRRAGCMRVALPLYAHRSARNACEALGMRCVTLAQRTEGGIPRQPSVRAMEEALAEADALLLVSPDYYGFFPDLAAARSLCTAAGKPLVIDGAHGSHLHGTPLHASVYADLWVDGLHKSLPALTQGAAVSAKGRFTAYLAEGAEHFRTSSPSYPILASVEYALKYPRNVRTERAAERAKEALGAVRNDDWTKLLLPCGARSDEAQAYFERRRVYPEFNDGNFLLFYFSPATRVRDIKKLVRLAKNAPRGEVRAENAVQGEGRGRTVLVPLGSAAGRVCARSCGIVPPCVPLIAAGSVVSARAAARLASARHTFGLTDGKILVWED